MLSYPLDWITATHSFLAWSKNHSPSSDWVNAATARRLTGFNRWRHIIWFYWSLSKPASVLPQVYIIETAHHCSLVCCHWIFGPKSRPKSKGDQIFCVRAPRLWNDLPEEMRPAVNLLTHFLKPIFMDSLLCNAVSSFWNPSFYFLSLLIYSFQLFFLFNLCSLFLWVRCCQGTLCYINSLFLLLLLNDKLCLVSMYLCF